MTNSDPIKVFKPTLLIIELNYHAEVLTAICPILAIRFSLIIWTTDKIWRKTGLDSSLFSETLIMPKKSSLQNFFQSHTSTIYSANLIYFNTLEKYFSFFEAIALPCPTIMRIHNVNTSLFPVESINWSLKASAKILAYTLRKMFFRDSWRTRKNLYLKMTLLMLPNSAIMGMAEEKLRDKGYKNLSTYCLPFFSLGKKLQVNSSGSEIVFAVTGSIDPERKDYRDLFSAIILFRNQSPKQKLRMLFLGAPRRKKGVEIVEQFKRLEDGMFKLEYYQDHVPQDTVDRKMQEVQFLVAPIKLKTKHKIHTEYYGKTKISGIENDAVNFRKPIIIPRDYILPDDLTPIAYSYHNTESLCQQLVYLGLNNGYKNAALEFEKLDDYRKETIAGNFYQLYQSIKVS